MKRLDKRLVEEGHCSSREQAKKSIQSGEVTVNGIIVDKVARQVKEEDVIAIKQSPCPYVSRGGLKLAKAMEGFGLFLEGKTAMDVGASTGGFTDCMLQNGARLVYAIDVGYGQLDWKLRKDERVSVFERTNFRKMMEESISEKVDFFTMDVSFISVRKLTEALLLFLKEDGEGVVLIKPQFEAGRSFVGKNGIVRDGKVHKRVVIDIIEDFENKGLFFRGLDYSPVKGAKGNIEYLLWVTRDHSKRAEADAELREKQILEVIDRAFSRL
ncbi:MAG TPA: TlyA family rRNA (cytidine-2'-O)-methyltransferase [Eubacteriaceae bacterium]|nr:TlyA family rRNA (cytidine-2'-O)-methyltransferase [Eubacteriaceae bacterium]